MTAINMEAFAEPYIRRRAIRHLEKGRVVIMGPVPDILTSVTDTAASYVPSRLKPTQS